MKKKIILCFLLILCFISPTSASTVKDLENKKNDIAKELKENKANLEKVLGEKSDIEAQIVETDIKLEEINSQIQIIELDLEEANGKLDISQEELSVLELERDNQKEILEARLRNMYEYGDTGYLNVIFSSTSFSDLLNRTQYIQYVNDYDNKIYEEYLESINKIELKIAEINEQISEIEMLQAEAEENQAKLEAEIENKKVLLAQAEDDIALNEASIAQLEAEEAEIQAQIKKAEEEAARTASMANFKYSGGKFGWPVPSITRINSYFGYRIHPIFGTKKLHAGIDISGPTGTDIVAAEDGVVTSASYMSGYGYAIIISHGNGYSTLYGHNSKLLVSKGDTVSKGQHISEMGSTGNSTGPHCHFEVRVNGTATDPLPYLK